MVSAKDIPFVPSLTRAVSSSLHISTSPGSNFQSPSGSYGPHSPRPGTGAPAKALKPFATKDIKILLLENVNQTGIDNLSGQGYQVEALKASLPEDELIEKIRWGRSLLSIASF
jgi:D-3-phosphoglycerate dehydrogenase